MINCLGFAGACLSCTNLLWQTRAPLADLCGFGFHKRLPAPQEDCKPLLFDGLLGMVKISRTRGKTPIIQQTI